MRLARVRQNGDTYLARIEGEAAVLLHRESSHPAADALREALGAGTDLASTSVGEVALEDCRLLSPVSSPSKLLGIGLNYADHAAESNLPLPETPTVFVKTTNAIIGPDESIMVDAATSPQVDYEVELAIVIGRHASGVPEGAARDYILGYTICNDVTARDAQFSDGQWVRSKSFDTFAPIGPWIVGETDVDAHALRLRTVINGETLQDGSTSQLVFSPSELVSYVSHYMTLEPGDVISTGTPPGVGFARTPPRFLTAGDEISMSISGIGELRNRVAASNVIRRTASAPPRSAR